LVEVNHPPTDCEPHELDPRKIIELMRPEFACESVCVYKPVRNGLYESILAGEKVPAPEETRECGYMSARFVRRMSAKVEVQKSGGANTRVASW
jgi:hypothetical protein